MASKKNAAKQTHPSTEAPVMHRQGDLLFIRQEALPTGVELTPRATNVILEGETTGHAHRVAETVPGLTGLTGVAILDSATGAWIDVPLGGQAAQVVHEEHHTVTLEPGVWLIVRQREYAPDAVRLVMD